MPQFLDIGCEHDGVPLAGFAARPSQTSAAALPAVIAFPGAAGGERRMRLTVTRLAELGYFAAAVSMYDARIDARDEQVAGRLFMELIDAPERLRARARAWFDAFAALPGVDPARLAAIGYCFGGKCVLELARSGADAKAVVSYHGLLRTHAPARAGDIKGHVAAWCAGRDPYAPLADVDVLQQELAAVAVPHQVTVFSDAEHAFTDPDAASHQQAGIAYDAIADQVSWAGTIALLGATLHAPG